MDKHTTKFDKITNCKQLFKNFLKRKLARKILMANENDYGIITAYLLQQ